MGINVILFYSGFIMLWGNNSSIQAISIIALISIAITARASANKCQQWKIDNNTILTEISLEIQKKHDLSIFLDAKDKGISSAIRQNGQHNIQLIRFMAKFVKQSENFIHVGAHIGIESLAMAGYARDQGIGDFHVHAFEPNQKNYILMVKSAYINDLQDLITVYKAAATDTIGTAELAIRNLDTSLAQIVPHTETKRKADEKYQVKTITLDSVFARSEEKFGLVYLSCNTYEIQAMLGMKELLKRNREVSVLVDWRFGRNGHKNVDGLIQLLAYFKQSQYKLYSLNETTSQWTQITPFLQITKLNQAKLLFLPQSRLYLIR